MKKMVRFHLNVDSKQPEERALAVELLKSSGTFRRYRLIDLAMKGLKAEKAFEGAIERFGAEQFKSEMENAFDKKTSEANSVESGEKIKSISQRVEETESVNIERDIAQSTSEAIDTDSGESEKTPSFTDIPIL